MTSQRFVWFLLWLLFATLFVAPVSCAGGSESSRHHRGDWSSSAPDDRERPDSHSFPKRFGFTDPTTGRSMSESYYDHIAQLASAQIDRTNYYPHHWPLIRTGSDVKIRDAAPTSLPSELSKHPNYLDYPLGGSHVPTVFIRVADELPRNPMGAYNPDIIVYMHAVRVWRDTDAKYALEPKFVLRGRLRDASSSSSRAPPYRVIWEKVNAYRRGWAWVYDLPRVFSSRSLGDIERLGYTPSTIERQVASLPHESDSTRYNSYSTDQMVGLLEQSHQYMAQFTSTEKQDDHMWYGLMSAQIDRNHRLRPWFQAPIFERFDLASGQTQLETYISDGQALPVLDRVMYTLSPTRNRLVPRAVVRPVRVVPEVRFETIYTIPASLQELTSVDLAYAPSLARPQWTQAEKYRPLRLLMDRPRPMGHPLDLFPPEPLSGSTAERSVRSATAESSRRSAHEQAEATTHRPPRPSFPPSLKMDVSDSKREQDEELDSRHKVRLSSYEDAERTPGNTAQPVEEPEIFFPASPNLVQGLEPTHPSPIPDPVALVQAHAGGAQAGHVYPQPFGPPRLEHRPAPQPAQPRQQVRFPHHRYDGPNPYEAPQDNAIDVLMAHLNPHVEDAWRYGDVWRYGHP